MITKQGCLDCANAICDECDGMQLVVAGWQYRYKLPLPDGSHANWNDISQERFEYSRTAFIHNYEYRELYALEKRNG